MTDFAAVASQIPLDAPLIQRAAVVALKAAHDANYEQKIVCPVCCDNYVHLVGSGVQTESTLHLIDGDGLHLVAGLPPLGRGSAVITIYAGECDHTFARVQRFHKGQTFIGDVVLPIAFESLNTLWRD